MQFDAALAAQDAFSQSESELGSDWDQATELENTRFPPTPARRDGWPMRGCLRLAQRYPTAHSFRAFCIYITWQQATEEIIARHFETGMKLCEAYLVSREARERRNVEQIEELYASFRAALGLEEEDEIQIEFRKDTPKGGD